MCAYNCVNGVPNCADYNLLTNIARGQWGFIGYITSDCDAVSIIHDAQAYAKVPEDAVADVLKAKDGYTSGGHRPLGGRVRERQRGGGTGGG